MNLSSLVANIANKLNFHNSRCHTFQEMVIGMIRQNNVQHHALTQSLTPKSSLKSKLERARRFFKRTRNSWDSFRKGVDFKHLEPDSKNAFNFRPHKLDVWITRYQLSRFSCQSWESCISLVLDAARSSRKLGYKSAHGYLNKFKEAFGLDKILSFSSDWEFIGKEWISYLLDHNISFFIRIKDNQLANDLDTKRPLKEFFHNLGTEETLNFPSIMDDPRLVIVGKKFKEENLVICSNVQDKDHVLRTYRQRWDIERLFRNMKTQGFNLENTQMKDLKRLSKLMAFIAIAILFSTITGLTQKCSYKKTVKSPLYSIFTKGLRWLKTKLLTFSFTKVFRLLQKSEGEYGYW